MYHRPVPDLILVLIVILVLALMWRGPKTLPKLGQALGRGVREARTEASKAQDEIQARMGGDDAPAPGPGRMTIGPAERVRRRGGPPRGGPEQ